MVPKGTLPEGEHDGWVLYYEDHPALLEIIQPWAIPVDPALFQDAGYSLLGYSEVLRFSDICVCYEPR